MNVAAELALPYGDIENVAAPSYGANTGILAAQGAAATSVCCSRKACPVRNFEIQTSPLRRFFKINTILRQSKEIKNF